MSTLESTQKAGVQKAIGTMASPLYMTMAKLYLCAPNETEWKDSDIWGACCVVFDRTPPSSRHIKIFETESGNFELKWSQEIYTNLQYNNPSPQFHTFEGHENIIGLSFEDPAEATEFMNTVKRMIPTGGNNLNSTSSNPGPQKKKSGFFSKIFGGKHEKAVEIGRPTDVVHKQHIGFDPTTGFETSDVPPEWASIFKNAGIKKKDLRNPETAKMIYETLQNELQNETYTQPPPLPPAFLAAQQQNNNNNSHDDTPVVSNSAPMPPGPPSIPTAPVISSNAPTAPPPPSFSTTAHSSDEKTHHAAPGNNHLAAIQAGMKLRKVDAPSQDSALPDVKALNQEETNTLASVLQKAMASRLKHVATEQPEEANDEADDWD